MRLPNGTKEIAKAALDTIEVCRVSQAQRAAAYRQYGQWVETGRAAGGLALANLLYGHLDRLASHLFSPTELRFAGDFENLMPPDWLAKGNLVARLVSREWERKNVDVLFGHGVKEALKYAACILKQLGGRDAEGGFHYRGARLVMPWHFGVYNEGVNGLTDQEALLETVWSSRHEVWRRVRNLPDAEKLYKRILGTAAKDNGVGVPTSFMHQVLSTAVLNTSPTSGVGPMPGGIVQLSNDPNFATLGPTVGTELYPMHELWIRDEDGDDYITVQLFEPDVLVAPLLKKTNLFCPEAQPYDLIQPNFEPGYFWGRSEVTDLMQLQSWLTEHLDDARRLMGQQVDKILGFIGWEGIDENTYGQFRAQGYVGMPQGSDIKDLTPKLPEQLIPIIGEIIQLMDRVSGFPPIMAGQGEPGVRAGVHADTLVKTGSPRLRDRSLLVERQCADAADTTLALLAAKDAKAYWTDPNNPEPSEFLISQLTESNLRMAVDSHSSSPIYADDHANLIAWGVKAGIVTPDMAIKLLPFPAAHKDEMLHALAQKQAQQKAMMEEHPEFFAKGGQHAGGGGGRGQPKLGVVG